VYADDIDEAGLPLVGIAVLPRRYHRGISGL
jgi:hypothetical protein